VNGAAPIVTIHGETVLAKFSQEGPERLIF
jgi:hypothetical protein